MRAFFCLLAATTLSGAPLLGQTSEACGVCHSRHLGEFKRSPHANAWTSEAFQAELGAVGTADFCAGCHAPASVWQEVDTRPQAEPGPPGQPRAEAPVDFDAILAAAPTAREDVREDGVSCGSCHLVKVFSPAGRREDFVGPYHTAEGHGGVEAEEFRTLRMCGSCHGRDPADYVPPDVTPGVDYHHARAVPVAFNYGVSECWSCHMPRQSGRLVQLRTYRDLPERQVGSHTFEGDRFERLGESVEYAASGNRLRITNRGVGHPLRVRLGTTYQLEVVASRGGTEIGKHEAEILGVGGLPMGDTLEVALPLDIQAGDTLAVRLVPSRKGQPVATPTPRSITAE
jgi:hypothetical protein